MLKLKNEKTISICSCEYEGKDVSGFILKAGDTGFTPEGTRLATDTDFHLSDGVLLDVLYEDDKELKIFNDFGDFPFPAPIRPVDIKPIYADNVKPFKNGIPYDGGYYHLKMFIMTKTFYNSSTIDKTKPALYYDDSHDMRRIIYLANGSELPMYDIKSLILFLHTIDTTTLKGLVIDESYEFSICHLQYCFNQKLKEVLDAKLGYDPKLNKFKCPSGDCLDGTEDENDIDFLRNALAALKYLIECENFGDAQRLINLLNRCGGICSKHVKVYGGCCK